MKIPLKKNQVYLNMNNGPPLQPTCSSLPAPSAQTQLNQPDRAESSSMC